MSLERIPAVAPLEKILEIYERDGGLILEGLYPQDLIGRLRDDLLATAEKCEPGTATLGLGEWGRKFNGRHNIRFTRMGKVSKAYFELLENETFAALSDAVLLPNCGSYWVNTAMAMFIGPGERAQWLHRDCNNWPQHTEPLWPDVPEVTISSIIALDEVTEAMGATRVIPGSHRWPDYKDNGKPEQTVPAELQAGDALIYSGKVVHGGGANATQDRWRHALHVSFCVGWLVPEECSPLDYTPEELAPYSPRVKRVLGHSSYDPRPHLGAGLWLRDVKEIDTPEA